MPSRWKILFIALSLHNVNYLSLLMFTLVTWLRSLFLWYLLKQKNFNFDEVQFIYFFFYPFLFLEFSKKTLPSPRTWRLTTVFSSYIFTVLAFILRSMIHFEFIFLYDKRKGFNFIMFTCEYSVIPTPFVTKIILSDWIVLGLLSKFNWPLT